MRLLITLIIALVSLTVSGQTTIPVGGGEAGMSSFTIGQQFYHYHSSMAQGIQLPRELYVITDIDQASTSSINVYPNPVKNKLKVEGVNIGDTYEIYDMSGILIESGTFDSVLSLISFHGRPPGTYILVIGKETFKILKQ